MELKPYVEKTFRFHDLWYSDGVRFKTYLIHAATEGIVDGHLLRDANAYLSANFPTTHREEAHAHGLGYVIVHAGTMRNWLLIHWWAYDDIVLRMIASADIGESRFVSQERRRFHACVWEHVVIDHERDAWVQHMLNGEPNPDAYVSDRLSDGDR